MKKIEVKEKTTVDVLTMFNKLENNIMSLTKEPIYVTEQGVERLKEDVDLICKYIDENRDCINFNIDKAKKFFELKIELFLKVRFCTCSELMHFRWDVINKVNIFVEMMILSRGQENDIT